MAVLNEAVEKIYTRVTPANWLFVNVEISPSAILVTEHDVSDKSEC